jgi:hypothetical protein
MTDTSDTGAERDRKQAYDRLWPLIASVIAGLLIAGCIAFGGTVLSGSTTNAVLTAKVDQIFDQNKAQVEQNRTQDSLLRDILFKQGNLPTREEVQRWQESVERRFQSVEARIDSGTRRIEAIEGQLRAVEQNQRITQQLVFDKIGPTRK